MRPGGIGRAVARTLAAAGWRALGIDLDGAGLDSLEVEAGVLPVISDMGDVDAIAGTFQSIAETQGRIDVLVNNAGVTRRSGILDLTESDWDRITRVNAKGVFFCMQHAARQMLTQDDGGRIINIASVAGQGYKGSSNAIYAGTKGAVIAMTKLAAHEFGPHGITVNAICPGVTETEIVQGIVARDAQDQGVCEDEIRARIRSNIPIGRTNTVDDVAQMVLYLASPGARNVTGQSMNVCGGLMMP